MNHKDKMKIYRNEKRSFLLFYFSVPIEILQKLGFKITPPVFWNTKILFFYFLLTFSTVLGGLNLFFPIEDKLKWPISIRIFDVIIVSFIASIVLTMIIKKISKKNNLINWSNYPN